METVALNWMDYSVIAAYMVVLLAMGLVLRKRAGGDMTSYFLAGRKMPGWLNGVSYAATCVNSDVAPAYCGMTVITGMLLIEFYRRARPVGWWGPIAAKAGGEANRGSRPIFAGLAIAVLGAVMVAAGTLALSCAYVGRYSRASLFACLALGVGIVFKRRYSTYMRRLHAEGGKEEVGDLTQDLACQPRRYC